MEEKIRARLKAEGGGTIIVRDSSPIDCEVHGVHTTWGALNPIQQLAVMEGIDTIPEHDCLLLTRANGIAEN